MTSTVFVHLVKTEQVIAQTNTTWQVSPGPCSLVKSWRSTLGVTSCQALAANTLRFLLHSSQIGLQATACSPAVPEPWWLVSGSKAPWATERTRTFCHHTACQCMTHLDPWAQLREAREMLEIVADHIPRRLWSCMFRWIVNIDYFITVYVAAPVCSCFISLCILVSRFLFC